MFIVLFLDSVEYELKNKEAIIAIGRLVTESDKENPQTSCDLGNLGSAFCMMRITEVKDSSYVYGYGSNKHKLTVGEVVRWRKAFAFAKDYEKGNAI